MLVGYYLWVYMVIRYHGRVWYYWWQRECVVRYVPPSTTHVHCEHEAIAVDNDGSYNGNSHSTLDGAAIIVTAEEYNSALVNDLVDKVTRSDGNIQQGSSQSDEVINVEDNH